MMGMFKLYHEFMRSFVHLADKLQVFEPYIE